MMRKSFIVSYGYKKAAQFVARGLWGIWPTNAGIGVIVSAVVNMFPTIVGRSVSRRGRNE